MKTYEQFVDELTNQLEDYEEYLGETIKQTVLRTRDAEVCYSAIAKADMDLSTNYFCQLFSKLLYDTITVGWKNAYDNYTTC